MFSKGSFRLLFLRFNRPLKAFLINGETFLFQNLNGQIDRETIRVIETESIFS